MKVNGWDGCDLTIPTSLFFCHPDGMEKLDGKIEVKPIR